MDNFQRADVCLDSGLVRRHRSAAGAAAAVLARGFFRQSQSSQVPFRWESR